MSFMDTLEANMAALELSSQPHRGHHPTGRAMRVWGFSTHIDSFDNIHVLVEDIMLMRQLIAAGVVAWHSSSYPNVSITVKIKLGLGECARVRDYLSQNIIINAELYDFNMQSTLTHNMGTTVAGTVLWFRDIATMSL